MYVHVSALYTYMYTHLLYTLLYTVKECDRLSLVTYDTQVYLDFGLTAMNRANKDRTKAVIGKLREGSCTNLCGGLMKGMYCVRAVPLIRKVLTLHATCTCTWGFFRGC